MCRGSLYYTNKKLGGNSTMRRIQFYPGEELDKRLTKKAEALGISVSKLVKDILENINIDSTLESSSNLNFYTSFNNVKLSVEKFVANSTEKEFVLRDVVEGWASIPQTTVSDNSGTLIPLPMRASLGTAFAAEVKAGKIPHVRVATRMKNGEEVTKVDRYRTIVYENLLVKEKVEDDLR